MYFIYHSRYLRACCEQVLFLATFVSFVCASVCLFVRTKSQKLLIRNWRNFVGICPLVNARSVWKFVIFDLDLDFESYFRTFSIQSICFEWLDLATLFSVWRCIFRTSRSRFSFSHGSEKGGSMQLKNYWPKIAGLDRNICYDNTGSN